MPKNLNWKAYSNDDRNVAIERIKEAILKNGGYILNFIKFSDLALSLSIEIEESDISKLHQALKGMLHISELKTEDINHESSEDWMIFLNVSFSKGKGELKIEIPNVPG